LIHDLTLGLVAIARTTFDMTLATEVTALLRAHLHAAGLPLAGPEAPVTTLDEARAAAAAFARPPDLLLILQATFADTSMVMALAESLDAPLLLWAVPEAHTGGRLRLNSLCGVNLAAHALTRAGRPYETLYARPDDTAALRPVWTALRAGQARRRLRQMRIGRVGEHPTGFETCAYDADRIKSVFGAAVVPVELAGVFSAAARADETVVAEVKRGLEVHVRDLDRLDQPALHGTLGVYTALRDLADTQRLDGVAVRCWPEFFTELGCAACGALSLMTNDHTPCSCEADVNGTLTQALLQTISGEAAMGADIVSVDDDLDGLVLWHCGLAPLSMADPTAQPVGTVHSNRQKPLLFEFPLKPGAVTLARLSEASGSYRLVIGVGEVVRAPKHFSGTSGVVRFARPARAVLADILAEGLEHHTALTYGDHAEVLFSLAKMLKLPTMRL
jgi:L-fucose isomerase-like protein